MFRRKMYPGKGYDILTVVRPEDDGEARKVAAELVELEASETRNPFKRWQENRRRSILGLQLSQIASTQVVGDTLQYQRELSAGVVMSPEHPEAPFMLAHIINAGKHQVVDESRPR